MTPSLPEVKAKVAPILEEAKKEAMPFMHAARYCLVWLCWLALVPFVWAGSALQEVGKKIKPELPPKSEP
jgi:hypothetical protein